MAKLSSMKIKVGQMQYEKQRMEQKSQMLKVWWFLGNTGPVLNPSCSTLYWCVLHCAVMFFINCCVSICSVPFLIRCAKLFM